MDKELEKIADECPNLSEVFKLFAEKNASLFCSEFVTGREGFQVIHSRKDYAIVHIDKDPFFANVIEMDGIYPFGSSVIYTLKPISR